MPLETTGLSIQTYEEALAFILQNEQAFISSQIDGSQETSLGQLNSIIASQVAILYQGLQDIYDARNIDVAEGVALDDIVSWIGITRQSAAATFGNIFLTGDVSSVIPSGTTFKSETNNSVFTLDENSTINVAACKDVTIRLIDAVDSGTDYTVSINGDSYASGTGHTTAAAMFGALETAIDGAALSYSAAVIDDTLVITSDDLSDMLISYATTLAASKATIEAGITSTVTGSIVQPANTVGVIVTPVAGLDSINNPIALVTGRAIETDSELRARAKAANGSTGRATSDSIISAILRLDGVSSCTVTPQYVSDGDAVSGQPAGSILVVVTGGTDDDIWQTIWDYKPAGVETWDAGVPANTNPAGVVVDTNGENQYTSFARPTSVPIYVNIEYVVFDTNTYPDTDTEAYDAITTAIIEFGNALATGEDVSSDEFVGIVYNSVGGIKDVVVEMSDIDMGSVAPDVVIAIGATDKALFATSTTQVANVTP